MPPKRKSIKEENDQDVALLLNREVERIKELMHGEVERLSKLVNKEFEKHSTLMTSYCGRFLKSIKIKESDLQSLERVEAERIKPIDQARKRPKKTENADYWYALTCKMLDNLKPLTQERKRLAERVRELEAAARESDSMIC